VVYKSPISEMKARELQQLIIPKLKKNRFLFKLGVAFLAPKSMLGFSFVAHNVHKAECETLTG
jgi:hypothetical protein